MFVKHINDKFLIIFGQCKKNTDISIYIIFIALELYIFFIILFNIILIYEIFTNE